MLTFFALAQARHRDLQREVAELRRLRVARTGDHTPPELSASERRARTAFFLKTLSRSKGDRPCLSTPHHG